MDDEIEDAENDFDIKEPSFAKAQDYGNLLISFVVLFNCTTVSY